MVSCFKITLFVALISILAPLIYKYSDQREFNYRTTAEEAINGVKLKGKVIIVTGSNTGIGKPTVKVLAEQGATVIMACRNKTKAIKAKKDIINEINTFSNEHLDDQIHTMILDLSSFKSIESFSKLFQRKYEKLNYLILNAGIMALPQWTPTQNGIESQFGINHIGHFYLTSLLTPILKQTALNEKNGNRKISRVISVSSSAHNMAPKPISDWFINDNLIQNKNEYGQWQNYGLSKAANILFANEYNKRYNNSNIYAISLHPGPIPTDLQRHMHPILKWLWHKVLAPLGLKTPSQGAATTVRLISIDDKEFKKYGGQYFSDCNLDLNVRSDLLPDNIEQNKMPQSLLWKLSENMIKKYK